MVNSIISGIIGFFTDLILRKFMDVVKKYPAKRCLGKNIPTEILLTYPALYPPVADYIFSHRPRVNKESIHKKYRIYPAVSEAELRSISYLTSLCQQNDISFQIQSDEKTDNDFESNLISIGFSCFKSFDTLENNSFVDVDDTQSIQIKGNDNPFCAKDNRQYGIILRITAKFGNTRIVCAGFNEWGTSGAAFCLATMYEQIIESIQKYRGCFKGVGKIPDFIAVTEGYTEMDQKSKILEIWILDKNQIPVRVFPNDNSKTH